MLSHSYETRNSVPNDVSLVQLDDPFWAQLLDPALTSLAQPVRSMAQSAIDAVPSIAQATEALGTPHIH